MRGRNRITGNRSVRPRPLAPLRCHPTDRDCQRCPEGSRKSVCGRNRNARLSDRFRCVPFLHRQNCLVWGMAARGLYKATDGSWRQADANKGVFRFSTGSERASVGPCWIGIARWWFTRTSRQRSSTRTGAWRRSPQTPMRSRGLSSPLVFICSTKLSRASAARAAGEAASGRASRTLLGSAAAQGARQPFYDVNSPAKNWRA